MSTIVKLISTEYLKSQTIIEMNVDDSKLTPMILRVQSVYLQQILGSSFMQHIYDAVTNSTLTADEDALIRNYIQPFIAEYTVYEALPFLNYKATNKSLAKESSEYSQPIDLAELKYMRSNVKDVAEFHSKRLEKYLCDNSSLFPEYMSPINPENLPKKSNSYFNGIYMKKRNSTNLPGWNEPEVGDN